MCDKDRSLRVGELMSELADCVQALKRARSEANDLVPELRVLADCFDEAVGDVGIDKMRGDTEFTFQDTPERRAARGRNISAAKRWSESPGRKEPLASIPSGERLVELVHRIQAAREEAERILCKLNTENVDVRAICEALSHT